MERKPRRYAAVIFFTAIGLLMAYPLSVGPAVMLLGTIGAGDHPLLADIVSCIYDRPLGLLPPGPLRDLLDWWINLWDIYDIAD